MSTFFKPQRSATIKPTSFREKGNHMSDHTSSPHRRLFLFITIGVLLCGAAVFHFVNRLRGSLNAQELNAEVPALSVGSASDPIPSGKKPSKEIDPGNEPVISLTFDHAPVADVRNPNPPQKEFEPSISRDKEFDH